MLNTVILEQLRKNNKARAKLMIALEVGPTTLYQALRYNDGRVLCSDKAIAVITQELNVTRDEVSPKWYRMGYINEAEFLREQVPETMDKDFDD